MLHRQRVVDDQLGRHHRIDLGRVSAALSDGIAQTGKVDQRGLTEDVMAHDARGVPRKIEITPTLDQLHETVAQLVRGAATHQVLGQYARGIGQTGIGAGGDVFHGGTRIEVVDRGTR